MVSSRIPSLLSPAPDPKETEAADDAAGWVARRTGIPPESICRHTPLANLGLSEADIRELSRIQRKFPSLPVTSPEDFSNLTLMDFSDSPTQQIAVTGIGCRFPGGVNSPRTYAALLQEGRDAITEVPQDRWDVEAFFDPDPDAIGKMYTRWGGFIDEVAAFDADFFRISPREARLMDPQQRLVLETTWHALEDAGISPASLSGSRTGIFMGASGSDYAMEMMRHPETLDIHGVTGSQSGLIAMRLAHFLGTEGPAMVVDTASSSSLTAIHLACKSLARKECDIAIAGGVNLILSPEPTIACCRARMMAADGRCKAFSQDADGYVRAEGCGIVILRRLRDSRLGGDSIRGILLGSASNQDGTGKGLTIPNAQAQEAVIRTALATACVRPDQVAYVECHGTGTRVGDPVECQALAAVFGNDQRKEPLRIGSVKTQIGHLEAAAGVAGLIKVLLSFEKNTLFANLHCTPPASHLGLSQIPAQVVTSHETWSETEKTRIAGISGFSIGGTNVHLTVAAPPPPRLSRPGIGSGLFFLSAPSAVAISRLIPRIADHLEQVDETALPPLAATAAGRGSHPVKVAVRAPSPDKIATALQKSVREQSWSTSPKKAPEIAMIFSGQGAQYPGMGKALFQECPPFREALTACATIMDHRILEEETPFLDLLFETDPESSRINDTRYTQPALFAIEYALWRMWQSFGLRPHAVSGHSIGEFSAACAAGALSLEDGLVLVSERGRLISGLPRTGGMIAVMAEETILKEILKTDSGIDIAAVNGKTQLTLSGPSDCMDVVIPKLKNAGIRHIPLLVSHAFHSSCMDPVLDQFQAVAETISFHPPTIPLISNLTGQEVDFKTLASPAYWRRHLRETVRFGEGIKTLGAMNTDIFLEVGPKPVLTATGRRETADASCRWLASLNPDTGDTDAIQDTIAALYLAGVPLDFKKIFGCHGNTALPLQPFERRRHWFSEPTSSAASNALSPAVSHPPRASPADPLTRLSLIVETLLERKSKPPADLPMAELGMDSLLTFQLQERIQEDFGIHLPLSRLSVRATLEEIALAISSTLPSPSAPENMHREEKPREASFPLTDIQHAYWIGRTDALALGNNSCHLYFEVDTASIPVSRVAATLDILVARHESLRTVILPDGYQKVLPKVPPVTIPVKDFRSAPDPEKAALVTRDLMSHQVLPTDQWPLFDIRASLLPEGVIRYHIGYDLLMGDGWSFQILASEIETLLLNPDAPLPPIGYTFREYVNTTGNTPVSTASEYWRNRIPTLPPGPDLPLACTPESIRKPLFRRRVFRLPPSQWECLQLHAGKTGVTPSGLLAAAFTEVLSAWSRTPRFSVTVTLFQRQPLHPDINRIVGDFTSLLILETDHSRSVPFRETASAVQNQFWEDLEHRAFSGVALLREMHTETSGPPTIPVVFTSFLSLAGNKGFRPEKIPVSVPFCLFQTPQVWLDHQVYEEAGALVCNWDAVEDLFPAGLLDDMMAAYEELLTRLADVPETWDAPVTDLRPKEMARRQDATNHTADPRLETEALLHTDFLAHATADPNRIAVITETDSLTYGRLWQIACGIRLKLQEESCQAGDLIPVIMHKGWEQIPAVLGILMAGAAYVPVDATAPRNRITAILADCGAKAVVVQPASLADLSFLSIPAITVTPAMAVDQRPTLLPALQTHRDPAYVIYTSGSTGHPKGVVIDHRGALNTIADLNLTHRISPEDRVLALAELNFDLSVYDLFGLLSAGGAIVLPDTGHAKDPATWQGLIQKHRISVWNTVPAMMRMLMDYVDDTPDSIAESLRLVLMSGDWIPVDLPDRIRQAAAGQPQIMSLGGATEASIWSVRYPVETVDSRWTAIPYGYPMRNQSIHVLDPRFRPCPDGCPGEIWIGGTGLALSYFRDPEKTAAAFRHHPVTGERLYRTGDLGRRHPEGYVEFLGREDFQIKLRGHRIELEEITSVLNRHPEVRDSVVTVTQGADHEDQLSAYVVMHNEIESGATDPADRFHPEGATLTKREERLAFKMEHRGIRSTPPSGPPIPLVSSCTEDTELSFFAQRATIRDFASGPLPLSAITELLGNLQAWQSPRLPFPKYRYGSAGGLYPVQTYIWIRSGAIEDLPGGIYYHHPLLHQLEPVTGDLPLTAAQFPPGNRETFENAAFALFLVADRSAMTPMYGERTHAFCLMEAGLISQLLEAESFALGIGLCQIGMIDTDSITRLLDLSSHHHYLHCLLGGALPPDWNLMDMADVQREMVSCRTTPSVQQILQEYLSSHLPAYMVPATVQTLPAIPLTANGKTDRKSLPAPPSRSTGASKTTAVMTETEAIIASFLSELLGVSGIKPESDFFTLGGDSLSAIQLITRIRKHFGTELPLARLFQDRTLSGIATFLDAQEICPETSPAPSLIRDTIEEASAPFPLTEIQQAYWIGRQHAYELGNVSTHIYYEIEMEQPDLPQLEAAWTAVVRHHGMLRARILTDGTQRILPPEERIRFSTTDMTHAQKQEQDAYRQALRREMSHQVLDLSQAPPYDIRVVRLPAGKVRLHMGFDALCLDLWSLFTAVSQWEALYRNPLISLEDPGLTFREYVRNESRSADAMNRQKDREYWMKRLAHLPPPPDLPLAVAPEEIETPHFFRFEQRIPRADWSCFKDHCRKSGLTPSVCLLAAYAQVLSRWCRSDRFTINLTLFNRLDLHSGVNDLVGDFTSLTLLAVENPGRLSFSGLARNLQEQLWQDMDHRQFGGVSVLRELARLNNGGNRALMPVVFTGALASEAFNRDASVFSRLGRRVYTVSQTPQVWLDQQVMEEDGSLVFSWDAVRELFPEGMVEEMFTAYADLLLSLSRPDASWDALLEIPIPAHQSARRAAVNATEMPFSPERLESLFSDAAIRYPDHPAILSNTRNMTYREVKCEAAAVAAQLLTWGLSPGDRVAVVLPKGWQQIVGVLGILAAGGVFVPLAPDAPPKRFRMMVKDCGIRFALVAKDAGIPLPEGVRGLDINRMAPAPANGPLLPVIGTPYDTAYIIYTSGSTGSPKGVVVSHAAAANTILDINRRFSVSPADRIFGISELTFDLSIYDIFGTLAAGAALVLPDPDRRKDPGHWLAIATSAGVTLWNSVPALFRMLLAYSPAEGINKISSLRSVLLSGDWIPTDIGRLAAPVAPDAALFSLGGATEVAIWSIFHPITEEDAAGTSIPYGRPLANQQFHILDRQGNPCPDWVSGDLHIGGKGLATGYWNDDVKTASAFFLHAITGERLYKTGDQGRYRQDGVIEFLGRDDDQVKVNGYRIELGEIESALTTLPQVQNAAARIITDGETPVIAGYWTAPHPIDATAIREHLQDHLPSYMVPSILMEIPSIPLSPNGKVDKTALPQPDPEIRDRPRTPPGTPEELQVFAAVVSVLETDAFGIHDRFFDIGANSIDLVRIHAVLVGQGNTSLAMVDLFAHPTVAELAATLTGAEQENPARRRRTPLRRRKKRSGNPVPPKGDAS